jgi:pilus assembly protein Flp/PilA
MVAVQMMFMQAMERFRSLREDESGQGLVEYALIISLVSIAVIGALQGLTGALDGVFKTIETAL